MCVWRASLWATRQLNGTALKWDLLKACEWKSKTNYFVKMCLNLISNPHIQRHPYTLTTISFLPNKYARYDGSVCIHTPRNGNCTCVIIWKPFPISTCFIKRSRSIIANSIWNRNDCIFVFFYIILIRERFVSCADLFIMDVILPIANLLHFSFVCDSSFDIWMCLSIHR